MDSKKGQEQEIIKKHLLKYFQSNKSAKWFYEEVVKKNNLDLFSLIDHITFRTKQVSGRFAEFSRIGYQPFGKRIESGSWWLQVYRHKDPHSGFPAIVLDQPADGFLTHYHEGGRIIDSWVSAFGDNEIHHTAFKVVNLECATKQFNSRGVPINWESFAEDKNTGLKQVFTIPQKKDGISHTVLELIERPLGCVDLIVGNTNILVSSTK